MQVSRINEDADGAAPAGEEVLPGVWRWADPAGTDRCGTALATADGLILVDPPALPAATRRHLERRAGPVRHVVFTSDRLWGLAQAQRQPDVTLWAGGAPAAPLAASPARGPGSAAPPIALPDTLPGGLVVCALPAGAAPDGEVALRWPGGAGPGDGGLLLTGDVLRVVGQTPVYREGGAPPIGAYLEAVAALLALGPAALAPAHQAPAQVQVVRATAWAAGLEHPRYRERAAPVRGPRFLVLEASRVLDEALRAPVIARRAGPPLAGATARGASPEAGEGSDTWITDPFACARCGRPNAPLRQTCSGPGVPRLCDGCRAATRDRPVEARVLVCEGGCCTRYGARAVASAARQALAACDLTERVDVVPVRCIGRCALGPYVRVATATGDEPEGAAALRTAAAQRARAQAAELHHTLDDEAELNLSRFAAGVRLDEAGSLVDGLAETLAAPERAAVT